MIFIILLGALFLYAAYAYYKKRRFYLHDAIELQGEVTFFEKRRGWKGQRNYPYYVLQIRANGQDYFIETDNSKARKYKKRTDVTILTPIEPELPPAPTSDPQITAMQDEIQQRLDELNSFSRTRMTILKEELPSVAEVIFIGGFGVLLALLGLLSLAEPLLRDIL